MLTEVDAAISAIVQKRRTSYTLPDGTTVTNLDLQKLFAMRTALQAEVAAAAAGNSGQACGFEPMEFRRE